MSKTFVMLERAFMSKFKEQLKRIEEALLKPMSDERSNLQGQFMELI